MIDRRPRRPWDRTLPSERDYFDVLGDGLLAQLAPPSGGAGRRAFPPALDAWLHVGPDGLVRAFTGKVEVGQGTRTARSLVVAEEMGVPLDRVDLVMGDTDLCPWDMGTFGSRSMPDAAPVLRAVSAGARNALGERARAQGSRKGAPFAELVRGIRKVVTVPRDTPVTPATDWRRAGRSAADPRATDVVTGRRVYASDVRRPGMEHGAVLHPPRMGARLVRCDLRRVRAVPGVTVVTEGDFVGTVARSPREARAALDEVEAEWEGGGGPAETEIEAYLRSHPSTGDAWDVDEVRTGDPEGALASSAFRLEATFRTAYIAHVPLETRAAVADWDHDRLTVWVGTQTPFRAREHVATGLGIPLEEVRVIVPFTGSGFGGKHGGDMALFAARLARARGAPVSLTYTREEEFRHGYFRPMALIDVRAGIDPNGHLRSWSFHNTNAGAAALETPYTVAHQRVDNTLSDSPLPQGPYRSLAANANNFARESAMDELAALAGLDPLAFRERNLEDERLRTVLRTAADRAGWSGRSRVPGTGWGLALGREKGGRVATIARVAVRPDKTVHVDRLVTVFEAGAAVHPDNLRSQMEGGAVMALGGALFESIHVHEGRVENPRLSQYRVPRFSDLPEIDAVLVDRPDLPSAGGGEAPMIAVAPAIANALYDATGVRLRSLPLVPSGRLPERRREDEGRPGRPRGRRSGRRGAS